MSSPSQQLLLASGGASRLSIIATVGSFALSGASVNLIRNMNVLAAGSGSFALSATGATLVYSGEVIPFDVIPQIPVTPEFGTPNVVQIARILAAGAGSFAISGTSANFITAKKISAGSASFSLSGTNATLTRSVPPDPSYANVVFLWEAEGTNHQSTGLVDGRNGRAITASGTAELSTTRARLGATSLFVGTGGASAANNADYQLGNTANSSQFCIEFSAFEGTLNTWEVLLFWNGSQKSWWIRLQSDGEIRFLASSTGTSTFSLDFTTSGFGFTAGSWHDICINKDTSGKIRFFRNGVMKSSTTPADSVFFASTNSPLLFSTQSTSDGYVDHIRLTKSDDRGRGDAGYTVDEFPFPTS